MTRPPTSSARSALVLLFVHSTGCVIPLFVGDGRGDGSGGGTGSDGGSRGDSMTSSSPADTSTSTPSSESDGESDTGISDGCPDAPEIPPPPVDCVAASTVIEGSVVIDEDNPDDIAMLEGVVEVTGSIRLSGLAITNLDVMACVTTVGGDVTIFDNDQLTDVDGLWSLTDIGTDFVLAQNDAIENFGGLPNLVELGNNLIILDNASLRSITGFHGLMGLVGGSVTIEDNPMLCLSSVLCLAERLFAPAEPPAAPTFPGNDASC